MVMAIIGHGGTTVAAKRGHYERLRTQRVHYFCFTFLFIQVSKPMKLLKFEPGQEIPWESKKKAISLAHELECLEFQTTQFFIFSPLACHFSYAYI